MTDVWFAIYGANLNLDADGNVETVIDAGLVRDTYFALCEAEGHGRPASSAPDPAPVLASLPAQRREVTPKRRGGATRS